MAGEWRTVTIEEIAERVAMGPFGSSIKVETFVPSGVPIISGQHLQGFKLDETPGFNFITEEHADRLKNANVKRGDIVFTHRGNIGQVSMVPNNSKFERYVVSQSQFYMRCDLSKVIPEYVVAFFKTLEGRHRLLANTSQVGVPSIAQPVTYLRTIEIPLPPLPEQRAIAHILGTLDGKIELNRRMNETLEAIAHAIFKAWFIDFDPVRAKMDGRWKKGQSLPGLPAHLYNLFPDRLVDSELGEIPEGWRVMRAGDALKAVGGGTPSTSEPDYWNGGEYCWATPKDLAGLAVPILLDTERKITEAGLSHISSGLLPEGTVLMSSRAPVGYLALSAVPVAINQGFIAMVCHGPVSNLYTLNWCHFKMDEIKQTASGTTFAEISKAAFRPILMLVPEERVMQIFTEKVQPFYSAIQKKLEQSRTLAALRDTLLPKLISGKLRVKDAEKNVGKTL